MGEDFTGGRRGGGKRLSLVERAKATAPRVNPERLARNPDLCKRRGCEVVVDRSRPRAKHQEYCSNRCRKLAWDDRQAAKAKEAAS